MECRQGPTQEKEVAEIDILLHERVELNAVTSDALVAMIERKLNEYGLKKVIYNGSMAVSKTAALAFVLPVLSRHR